MATPQSTAGRLQHQRNLSPSYKHGQPLGSGSLDVRNQNRSGLSGQLDTNQQASERDFSPRYTRANRQKDYRAAYQGKQQLQSQRDEEMPKIGLQGTPGRRFKKSTMKYVSFRWWVDFLASLLTLEGWFNLINPLKIKGPEDLIFRGLLGGIIVTPIIFFLKLIGGVLLASVVIENLLPI